VLAGAYLPPKSGGGQIQCIMRFMQYELMRYEKVNCIGIMSTLAMGGTGIQIHIEIKQVFFVYDE
jgi:hypothetical protein